MLSTRILQDLSGRTQRLINNRRLIGRRFDDETVKKDIESWPFKVVDQGGSPMVQVEYLGETKTFSPQEISAMVLGKVCIFRSVPVAPTLTFCR